MKGQLPHFLGSKLELTVLMKPPRPMTTDILPDPPYGCLIVAAARVLFPAKTTHVMSSQLCLAAKEFI
jgi:hypothetical protein